MISDKEFKKYFRKIASENYREYFPVKVLTSLGFKRYQCKKCKKFFWSRKPREFCDDPKCSYGYTFIGKEFQKKMNFPQVWIEFSKLFEKKGYKPIKRYPVVARWNPTVEFTIASITDFQPYVVSGEVEPIARLLVVPQICLRFNDIENVGLTGRHYTGFTMIGQHAFMPKEEYDQEKYFLDYLDWFTTGMGLSLDEIIIHEDAWAGGGFAGPCLEFFSYGLEIGNQVYMMFERTSDYDIKELKIKVLDMGMGQERVAWFLNSKKISYEVVMPSVVNYLYQITGIKPSHDIINRFIPLSGYLDIDEKDINETLKIIAEKIKIKEKELKDIIFPLSAIYAIADHSRTLLYAISDGALPSNVGGGYNLRVIFRRMLGLMEKYNIKVELSKIFELHAKDLEPIYPEFKENLNEVNKIINVELKKYYNNRKRSISIINNIIKKEKISTEDLVKLYDTHGITPEEIKTALKERGKDIEIPTNFYSLISQLHERKINKTQTERKSIEINEDIPRTKILYYNDFSLTEFKAIVVYSKGRYVILDSTAFYPTSGGQDHDTGYIENLKVIDVFKYKDYIVHELESEVHFNKGTIVKCKIDFERRLRLTQHHTATHIINGIARKILGNHIWQAGASKTVEKARLDLTHYEILDEKTIKKIEELANEVIDEDIVINKFFMPRNIAELKYGFRIYQGGAVPGRLLRIVEIPNVDVEACGGTHLNTTSQCELIKIIKCTKVQDGVIRLEFVAGKSALEFIKKEEEMINEIKKILKCEREEIPGRAKELFDIWKKVVKKKKSIAKFELKSKEKFYGDVLKETSKILRTQPEHVINTIKRFIKEINEKLEN